MQPETARAATSQGVASPVVPVRSLRVRRARRARRRTRRTPTLLVALLLLFAGVDAGEPPAARAERQVTHGFASRVRADLGAFRRAARDALLELDAELRALELRLAGGEHPAALVLPLAARLDALAHELDARRAATHADVQRAARRLVDRAGAAAALPPGMDALARAPEGPLADLLDDWLRHAVRHVRALLAQLVARIEVAG